MKNKNIIDKKPDEIKIEKAMIKAEHSANSFFHYMRRIDYLSKMLKTKKVIPRFCDEDLSELQIDDCKVINIAMKCFCDIPLHNISSHKKTYGNICIGFSKQWGLKNGLQPVIYYNKASSFAKSIKTSFDAAIKLEDDNVIIDDLEESLNETLKYLKISEGYYKRTKRYKVFTDEQEWRYVPKIELDSEFEFSEVIPDQSSMAYPKLIDNANKLLEKSDKYVLRFEYDDVKYLFVKTVKQREKLIDVILKSNSDEKSKLTLISKINVWDEVEGDF